MTSIQALVIYRVSLKWHDLALHLYSVLILYEQAGDGALGLVLQSSSLGSLFLLADLPKARNTRVCSEKTMSWPAPVPFMKQMLKVLEEILLTGN